MKDYVLERTPKTPKIQASAKGEILIEGISIPEDVSKHFEDFMIWLNEYCKTPSDKTVLNIKLAYFNTSSAALLLNIFKSLLKLKSPDKQVIINWFFEKGDVEIEESGYDFASLINLEFNVICYEK